MRYAIGNRIVAYVYGIMQVGTVTDVGTSGIVFARMDSGFMRWFHPSTLRHLETN